MFNSKTFKIPHAIKKVESFNLDVMDSLFSNMKEGVYGFESVTNEYESENYLIAPTYHRLEHGIETDPPYDMIQMSIDHLHCYESLLMQPSFLPLLLEGGQLWDDLQLFKIPNVYLFVQFLFRKSQMDYNKLFIDQYRHYLNGNDRPSHRKMGRYVQSKILNLSSRIIQLDLKRDRDKDIDDKIIDKGYDFNFRIMIYCKDERYIKPIEDELNGVLRELDYYNQLRLVKVNQKEVESYLSNYIQHELSSYGEPQILSETELLSLFVANMYSTSDTSTNNKENSTQQSKVGINHSGVDLLPKSPITNREIDESIGDRIVQAIKELKLNKGKSVNIVEQTRSATLQRVTMEIPKGVKFSDIEKSYKDIKAIVGFDSFVIEPGHIGGTVTFNIPSDEREIVYLRDMMETEQYRKVKNEYTLPLVIGLDTLGEPLIVDLAALPHLLIGGTTGGGKSYLLNSLILNLLLSKKPHELNMYLVDPKKVEFPIFDGFSNTKIVTSVDDTISLFDQICNEMDRRYDEFSKVKVRDIKGYNNKFPNKKLPYNVVVVDELADLMITSQKQVEEYIVRLGQLARASGIHIILATQRPDAEVVTGIIKANIASRIALSVSDYRNSQIIIDQKGAEKLLGKGDGLAKIIGQKRELIRFQSPVITLDDSELEDILDGLKDGVSGENVDVIEENEEEPIEKMKRIIAQTGIVTISDLQKEMGIRINVVSELRKQLIDDGWLVQDGRSYRVADEGELELYRGE